MAIEALAAEYGVTGEWLIDAYKDAKAYAKRMEIEETKNGYILRQEGTFKVLPDEITLIQEINKSLLSWTLSHPKPTRGE